MNDTITTSSTSSITMSHAQLTSIASLAACASTELHMPVISGIHLNANPGLITATATDRYVATWCEFFSDSITAEFSVTIPVKELKQFVTMSKLTGRFNTDVERITITVSDTTITFSDLNTGSTLTTTAINGTYPPLARLFPEVTDEPATITPYGINPALLATVAKINVLGEKAPSWIVQHTEPAPGKTAPVMYYVKVGTRAVFRVLVQPRMHTTR
jgi:DNA polymerase III sliding clamp (beta) subunit (PCNA family)